MSPFRIDADNRIRTVTSNRISSSSPTKGFQFSTEKELADFGISWPQQRFVEIWNNLPGVRRVGRFADRKIAIRRIWRALAAQSTAEAKSAPITARSGVKSHLILALLSRAAGATLQELKSATGWQSHSIRGFISGQLKKKGRRVHSFKRSGERVYRIHPGSSRISKA